MDDSDSWQGIDPDFIGQIKGEPLTVKGLYQALIAIWNECNFQHYGEYEEADVEYIRDTVLQALTGYIHTDEEWTLIKDRFRDLQRFDADQYYDE